MILRLGYDIQFELAAPVAMVALPISSSPTSCS
jgi:hypothetical protein